MGINPDLIQSHYDWGLRSHPYMSNMTMKNNALAQRRMFAVAGVLNQVLLMNIR